jgi:hypothetical protein
MKHAEQAGYDATRSGVKIVMRPVRIGEKDLLEGRENANFVVRGATANVLFSASPSTPWTHEAILSLLNQDELVRLVQEEGYADAYLSDCFIGSTEV